MIEPKLSVILPVYNGGRYLSATINSVLEQSLSDFELIIVNDASTDDSKNIIFSFNDERIRYFENSKNIGQIASVNKGINYSKSDMIARIDQDDIFLKEKLKVQYNFLKNNSDICIVGTWATIINSNDRIIKRMSSPTCNNKMVNTLLNSSPLFHPSIVIRKDALTKMGSYCEKYEFAEDYHLWCKLILSGYKIANIPDHLLMYRVHCAQSSSKNSSIQFNNAITIRNNFFSGINKDLFSSNRKILNDFNIKELSEIAYTCSDIYAQKYDLKGSKRCLLMSINLNRLNLKAYLMFLLLLLNKTIYRNFVIFKNVYRSKLVER